MQGEQQPTHMQGDESPATIDPVPQQSTAAASSDAPQSSKRDTEHEDSGGDSKRLHSELLTLRCLMEMLCHRHHSLKLDVI